jgi:GH35 family endo-1,4-beta-xylanase
MILLALLLALAACGPAAPPRIATGSSTLATAAALETTTAGAAMTPQPPATTAAEAATTTAVAIEPATATAAAIEPATATAVVASEAPAATAVAATAVTTAVAPDQTPAATAPSVAATETAAASQPLMQAAATVNRPQFGAVAHLYYTDKARVTQLAENAGFEWIRQQVPWKDTENADRTFGFGELDSVVEAVSARKLKLMLSITKSPDFLTGRKDDNGLPKDPKDFARFAEAIATRYKGKVQAIEVWNEQNLSVENGGHVAPADAGRYVELLKEAYTRIKAVDPTIVVVAGALSSTGVTKEDTAVDDMTYLRAMYAYNDGEIKNYFDAQGFHPASAANPPDTKFPETPGCSCGWNNHPTHFFRHIEDVRKVMQDAGAADKKIWITEMGWATTNNTPGYEYGKYVSSEQQAEYLKGALDRISSKYKSWVGAVFIWNLNFSVLWGTAGNPLHEQAAFSLLNPDWSPRPAFNRVQGVIHAVKQQR